MNAMTKLVLLFITLMKNRKDIQLYLTFRGSVTISVIQKLHQKRIKLTLIVHWGTNPSQKHHPLLSCQAPLKLANCQVPLFRQSPLSPLEKCHPSHCSCQKLCLCRLKPPPFWKLGGRFNPSPLSLHTMTLRNTTFVWLSFGKKEQL